MTGAPLPLTPARFTLKLKRETPLEQWARDEIERAGGLLIKVSSPGTKGFPDDLCLWYRRAARRGYHKLVHFLEFKLIDTEPDDSQLLVHAALANMGHQVMIVRSREWVLEYIAKYRGDHDDGVSPEAVPAPGI